jgi:hypothetical protein
MLLVLLRCVFVPEMMQGRAPEVGKSPYDLCCYDVKSNQLKMIKEYNVPNHCDLDAIFGPKIGKLYFSQMLVQKNFRGNILYSFLGYQKFIIIYLL